VLLAEKNSVAKIESECRVPFPALGSPALIERLRTGFGLTRVGKYAQARRGPGPAKPIYAELFAHTTSSLYSNAALTMREFR
jgi:hypothetical protein